MEARQKLLIAAFYLAKFNEEAVRNLGYAGFRDAFNNIGATLNYSPNSVKNRRDDFDPLFDHRAGWHQVELGRSNLEIVDNFDHLSEEALRAIVLDLLDKESLDEIILPNSNRQSSIYTTRGVTGRKAEEFFMKWFATFHPDKTLIDKRDLGCGYDFGIENSSHVYEVKGLSENDGGVLFTDKEWKVATELQNDYHLVLVKNCLSENPIVETYSNPHFRFSPNKQVRMVVNVSWGISSNDLNNTEKD